MTESTSDDEAWEAAIASALAEAATRGGDAHLDVEDVLLRAWQLWLAGLDHPPDHG